MYLHFSELGGPGAVCRFRVRSFDQSGRPEASARGEVDDCSEKLLVGGKAQQCGGLTDKYGVSWQIVPTVLGEMPQDKDAAKSQRAMRVMMTMIKLDIAALKKVDDGK